MLFYSVQFYSVNMYHNKIQTGLYSLHLVRLRKNTCANISGSNTVLIDIENLFAPELQSRRIASVMWQGFGMHKIII